jgi:hypothetical protein
MEGTNVLGAAGVNSSGVATLTTSALGVGSHTITAVYYSDLVYATSTGDDSANQQVVQDGTTTSVSTAPNPSVSGQSVTVTALVTSQGTGAGTPTGTVTFTEGSTVLASGVSVDSTGHAAFSISTLPAGSHTITATFTGTTGWLTSSGSNSGSPLVVNKANTTTAVVSSVNPSVSGQSVTFTATVTVNAPGSQAAANPTGTVTFYDGGMAIGTGTLSNTATDTATFTTSTLTTTSHTITAAYTSGDTNFNASPASASITQTVNKANTTTTVVSSVNPSVSGQSVTFTATVAVNAPGSQAAANPTGTVTFYDGGTAIGTGTLSNTATDTATFTTSALSTATHAITAAYTGGDANFNASSASASISQVVSKDATGTALTSSPNPSNVGQPVTFTATVTASAPGSGVPTGTVTFRTAKSTLGTGTLDSSGHASITVSTLPAGSITVTALYNGDANFLTSSGTTVQTVTNGKQDTSTTVVSSLNPSPHGQPVTFTATVSHSGSGTPTGTVSFIDGKVVLGTTSLSSAGTATFTTSNLPIGRHSITARYNGDNNFNPSTSPVLIQVVTLSQPTPIKLGATQAPGEVSNGVAAGNGRSPEWKITEATRLLDSVEEKLSLSRILPTKGLDDDGRPAVLGEKPIGNEALDVAVLDRLFDSFRS